MSLRNRLKLDHSFHRKKDNQLKYKLFFGNEYNQIGMEMFFINTRRTVIFILVKQKGLLL